MKSYTNVEFIKDELGFRVLRGASQYLAATMYWKSNEEYLTDIREAFNFLWELEKRAKPVSLLERHHIHEEHPQQGL